MVWVVLATAWVLAGLLTYGMTLGYFSHLFPQFEHRRFALKYATGGLFTAPLALAYAWDGSKIHFRLRPIKTN